MNASFYFPAMAYFASRARVVWLLFLVALIAWPGRSQAHPHAWIDVQSTVVFNDAGKIAAIEQRWRFDELYTAALIHGMTDGQRLRPEILAQYTRDVIENLGPYGYFTRVRADGHLVALGKVTLYQGVLEGKRFVLSFTAPLAAPLDPGGRQVEFAVYDPTYFIQMMHRDTDPPRLI